MNRMSVKNYQEIPSSAIKNIVIDTENNTVSIQYNSSEKNYTYSTEDAVSFDQQLLAEFDSEDISVGSFINQNISSGALQLLTNWPYHILNSLSRGDCTNLGINIPCRRF